MKVVLELLRRYRFPLVSLGVCILAYGLLIPWLGFFWDDWPQAWLSYQFSPAHFIGYSPYRPASGFLYTVSFSLLQESPIAWQLYALLWRWLSVLAFWWLLRLLWPQRTRLAALGGLLFAVYPGFSQQPIAVTYSLYWMYYTFFLVSLGLTIFSLRDKKRRVFFTASSLLLSAITMLATEYFYGPELVRGLLIWIALANSNHRGRRRIKEALTAWAPYLILMTGVFTWRYYMASQPENLYAASLIGNLLARPFDTLARMIPTVFGDLFEAAAIAWARVIPASGQLVLGSLSTWLYILVALSTLGLATMAFWWRQRNRSSSPPAEAWLLGGAALTLGGLSFWMAELPLRLSFAWDRFTLPMMLGACLLLAALLDLLIEKWRGTLLLAAALVGLAAGYQLFNTNQYREEWEAQRTMFQQLVWRAPSIAANTALLSVENSLEHYTDNSLTAPLLWVYSGKIADGSAPYYLAYIDLRGNEALLGGEEAIDKVYLNGRFKAQSENVLFFYYAPPACLRILDPDLDALLPGLPGILKDQAYRSNLGRIGIQANQTMTDFPYWNTEPDNSWCYYFEKADLARQFQDWEEVARLGDLAFDLEDAPNHPAERTPFIEGYAQVGEWQRAVQLSREALDINPQMEPMLCALWQQISERTPDSDGRQVALRSINDLLTCRTN